MSECGCVPACVGVCLHACVCVVTGRYNARVMLITPILVGYSTLTQLRHNLYTTEIQATNVLYLYNHLNTYNYMFTKV